MPIIPRKKKSLGQFDSQGLWTMHLIVRESLNLTPAQVVVQCGHAVGLLYNHFNDLTIYIEKCLSGYNFANDLPKDDYQKWNDFKYWSSNIASKDIWLARDDQWQMLKNELNCVVVTDFDVAGTNETVIGVWPCLKTQTPSLFQKLQRMK